MKRASKRSVPQAELLEPQLFSVSEPARSYDARSVVPSGASVPGATREAAVSVESLTTLAKSVLEGGFSPL